MQVPAFYARIKSSSRIHNLRDYVWDLLVNGFMASYLVPTGWRTKFLNLLGCETNSCIHGHCYIESARFRMGKGGYVNRMCTINNASGMVSVGEGCALAYGVKIYTTAHETTCPSRRAGVVHSKDVSIGNGVWIGANAIITPGSIIGDGVVVAAGAVVVGTLEKDYLYGGIPAKKIRKLNEVMEAEN